MPLIRGPCSRVAAIQIRIAESQLFRDERFSKRVIQHMHCSPCSQIQGLEMLFLLADSKNGPAPDPRDLVELTSLGLLGPPEGAPVPGCPGGDISRRHIPGAVASHEQPETMASNPGGSGGGHGGGAKIFHTDIDFVRTTVEALGLLTYMLLT